MRKLALLFAVLAACADEPEPTAAEEAEAIASPFAPSGSYAVEVKVLADDCEPAHAAPPPWQARVLVQAERGRAKVNLPLSSLSAAGPSRATARSDFRLEQGYTVEHRSTPRLGCDDFAIDATMVLTDTSPTGFTIETTLDYGDAAACGLPGPRPCTTRFAHTYTLVSSSCPAECTRGEHAVAPGATFESPRWEIDCECPRTATSSSAP